MSILDFVMEVRTPDKYRGDVGKVATKISTHKYQEKRQKYQNDGMVVKFKYKWHCSQYGFMLQITFTSPLGIGLKGCVANKVVIDG